MMTSGLKFFFHAEALEKGGKALDREGRKVVNYKLPAQITGALFDR